MDQLNSILDEQAQTVIKRDDMAFHVKERPLNFPSMSSTFCPLPSPSDIKPFAPHKVNKSVKKRTWKKPKDKPKRPLSAYNLFFQHERKKIIAVLPADKSVRNDGLSDEQRRGKHRKTHGKIGFGDLARSIAYNWKTTDKLARSIFEARADTEKARYKKELDVWKKTQTDSEKTAKAAEKNNKTQQAQLLVQFMTNNQALAQFQQQDMNDADVYEVLMASCSEHLLHCQRGNFDEPRRLSLSNNLCVNSVPQTNQLAMADSTSSSYTTLFIDQCLALSSETFSKEHFFEDVDDTSPEVFSDAESESSLDVYLEDAFIASFDSDAESSREQYLDAFIDDFNSEILLDWSCFLYHSFSIWIDIHFALRIT